MTSTSLLHAALEERRAASRFWSDVQRGDKHQCWPWVGTRGTRERTGHVRIWHEGTKVYAHRVAFQLGGGDLTEGPVIRHTCDRPECMNPHHLLAGTQADNVRDREQRNRRTPFLPHGERHWSAKLSDKDADRIRAARQIGLAAQDVARLFGVSRSTVYNVWAGVHYRSPANEEAMPVSPCVAA